MKPTKIKVGSAAIKIYHGKSNGYPLHTVAWHVGDQRQRKTFADSAEARRFADTVLKPAIRKNEILALKLTGADREAYVHAMELLKPLNVPLSVAVEDYVKRKAGANDRPLEEVVEELLESRSGHSPRYHQSLKSHLKRFADIFHYNIGGITTAMMVNWIDRLKLSPRGRKNARQSLVTLFHFARSRGYLPKHVPTEADDIETIKEPETHIGILTPSQLAKLLEVLDGKAALYVALGAFTGIRSAELLKLNWSNLRSDPGYVHIDAKIAKTGAQRYVPVLPNLAEFLATYSRARGLLFNSRRLVDRVTAIAKRNGVPWPNNCLRHSFASYRIAATQNWNQVADEMGTSYEKLKANYRKPIKPETGKAWFAIARKHAGRIVAFQTA